MKTAKKLIVALTCAVVLAAGVYYVQSARSETRLRNLVAKGSGVEQQGYDPAKEPARKERAWKLYQLWLARHDRDIAADVVPFLDDEYWLLRHNAVRILGRTESPVAEAHLKKLLTEVQEQRSAAMRQRVAADPLRTAPKPMLSAPSQELLFNVLQMM